MGSAEDHTVFTTYLFTHNIRVSIFAFALGFTFGIGTILLLFYNGTILGCLAYLYYQDGVFTFFVAWIGPHGALELPSIIFGATAGLLIGRALLRRNEGTFQQQLRTLRPHLLNLIVGTACCLVVAGIVEGGFSQINEPTLSYPFKIGVAIALFAGLVGWLWRAGRPTDSASAIGTGADT